MTSIVTKTGVYNIMSFPNNQEIVVLRYFHYSFSFDPHQRPESYCLSSVLSMKLDFSIFMGYLIRSRNCALLKDRKKSTRTIFLRGFNLIVHRSPSDQIPQECYSRRCRITALLGYRACPLLRLLMVNQSCSSVAYL
jgi:hypothetical protein